MTVWLLKKLRRFKAKRTQKRIEKIVLKIVVNQGGLGGISWRLMDAILEKVKVELDQETLFHCYIDIEAAYMFLWIALIEIIADKSVCKAFSLELKRSSPRFVLRYQPKILTGTKNGQSRESEWKNIISRRYSHLQDKFINITLIEHRHGSYQGTTKFTAGLSASLGETMQLHLDEAPKEIALLIEKEFNSYFQRQWIISIQKVLLKLRFPDDENL